MQIVDFHPPSYYPQCGLVFVIIGARYKGKWVFIKHKHRKGYELPAGHIDEEEHPDSAARRELAEETGALEYELECISAYTVSDDGEMRAGRLYYAEIEKLGQQIDEDEIDDVILSDSLPSQLTFPYVQGMLFDYLEKHRLNQKSPG